MAGFAIFMSVLFYCFFGLIAAGVVAICLRLYTKAKLPEEDFRRDRAIARSTYAPFIGLAWFFAAFFIHVFLSNKIAHQDSGFSADPYVTLPNGYILGSANTYDGYIVAPGFHTGVPVEGQGYVRSLIDLQLSGDIFRGTQFDLKTSKVKRFVFNAQTHIYTSVNLTPEEAAQLQNRTLSKWAGGQANPDNDKDSYWAMYMRYKHSWPSYVFIALICIGEAFIAGWVLKSWFTHRLSPV